MPKERTFTSDPDINAVLETIENKKRRWETKMYLLKICACCGKHPVRASKSGKSKLCEECNEKQRVRMRLRKRAATTQRNMIKMNNELSRYRGCLLGLAVGDAVGTTLEFEMPGSFDPIADMIGVGPFSLEPGQWTDDTSMALCLAESLIKKNGFDARDQMERYLRWWKEGYMSVTGHCFDIGNATRAALDKFRNTGDPFSGSSDAYSSGNGSIMRLAPIPMFFRGKSNLVSLAAESSLTTHASHACVDACEAMATLISAILSGSDKDSALSEKAATKFLEKHPVCTEIRDIILGSYKEKNPPDIRGSGYVVHTFEAAMWAFYHTDNFKDGLLKVVNLGEDADTTGAVYGQIAGAYYGKEGIPAEWIERLYWRERIEQMADKLCDLNRSN